MMILYWYDDQKSLACFKTSETNIVIDDSSDDFQIFIRSPKCVEIVRSDDMFGICLVVMMDMVHPVVLGMTKQLAYIFESNGSRLGLTRVRGQSSLCPEVRCAWRMMKVQTTYQLLGVNQ